MPKYAIKNTKTLNEISKRHFNRLARRQADANLKKYKCTAARHTPNVQKTFNTTTSEVSSGLTNKNFEISNGIDDCFNHDIIVDQNINSFMDEPHAHQSHFLQNMIQTPLKFVLLAWVLRHNITNSALDDLLSVLRQFEWGKDLPKDSRTLKKTPRETKITTVEPGTYCHFGLENGITETLKSNPDVLKSNTPYDQISVKVGIDGLSLSDSNTSQLWPILGCVQPTKHVFVIGIYHGYEKPQDSNKFLEEFVSELTVLIDNGLVIGGKKLNVKLHSIVCDAPAKSFITKTKGHAGFHSCTKCIQEGEYIKNRVCFPELNCPLRTDASFMSQEHYGYHMGVSILTQIPGFNPVTQIPLEYMHLVCIGVVKKVVSLWSNKGSYNVKMSSRELQNLSNNLSKIKPFIPCEFSRKPQDIRVISQWKATELRQFILYTSPVVLKNLLIDRAHIYNHFMTLHVAMRILTNSDLLKRFNEYAQKLLHHFVQSFIILYGKEFVSHNVHGLLHIVDDAKQFGTLDEFSAFSFENYMRLLVSKVKKPEKPLQQLHRRYIEHSKNFKFRSEERHVTTSLLLDIVHNDGPLIDAEYNYVQYKTLKSVAWTLKVSSPDNCALLEDETVIQISNFIVNTVDNRKYVLGKECKSAGSIYNKPCESEVMKCKLILEQPLEPYRSWPISKISAKCVRLPYANGTFAVFPLQHCL